MRVWHIPFQYMDTQRIVAQHREIHGLLTCAKNGTNWGGLLTRYHDQLGYWKEVHDACVAELALRKDSGPHPTPYDLSEFPTIRQETYAPTKDELIRDVTHLRQKWEDEGYYHGVGRIDITGYECDLGMEPGRDFADCYHQRDLTREWCRHNKGLMTRFKHLKMTERLIAMKEDLEHTQNPDNVFPKLVL